MSSPVADRNLLFGILAVQMDFVSQDQLMAGMNAWVLDKGKPLGAYLVSSGALSADTHQLLQALVDKHIEQHNGDVEQSLAAVAPGAEVRDQLTRIANADAQTSLGCAAETSAPDGYATIMRPQPTPLDEDDRFEILRPHARGGLGQVSVARDKHLNREVALKELLANIADNESNRGRFVQEAEITGGLEHPGVVPIYALGQYSDGRPYYAMRFIRGDSLLEALRRFHRKADSRWQEADAQIGLRRLLGRMIDVCNAIEYAHNRGVLHRDLKPANIMLGQYGETLVVDWGLAKVMGKPGAASQDARPVDPSTVIHRSEPKISPSVGAEPTRMGLVIGTPAYMSPEQAAGRLDQLGPASDIYSLGATLYTVLTDQSPQDNDDLGIVLARVQRGDFVPPREVKPVIPRPLEAICLKAMALEAQDRYASAQAMADDLEAWLADEPIAALAEPWSVRTRRWVKKHRALVSSVAGIVLASLVASLLGVALLTKANKDLLAARDAEQTAKLKAQDAEQKANDALEEANRQSDRNAQLVQLARDSLKRYELLSKSELLEPYGMESVRSELQEAALEFYVALAEQSGESEDTRAARADAQYRVGRTYWQMGRLTKSLEAFEKAAQFYADLERAYPDNVDYARGFAVVSAAIGEHLVNTQQSLAAAKPLEESRQRLLQILETKPRDLDAAGALADGWALEGERLRQLGRFQDAADCFGKAVAKLEEVRSWPFDNDLHREYNVRYAQALDQHATIRWKVLWQFDGAPQMYETARDMLAEEYRARPEKTDIGCSLAKTLRHQAELDLLQSRPDEARRAYTDAVNLMLDINRKSPGVPHYRFELAELLVGAAGLPPTSERPGKMRVTRRERIEPAVFIAKNLLDEAPQRTDYKLALARYQGALGEARTELGQVANAQQEFEAAVKLLQQLSAQSQSNVDNLVNTAMLTDGLAAQLESSGRPDDALRLLQRAEQQFDELLDKAPDFRQAVLALARIHVRQAKILGMNHRWVDAVKQLDATQALSDQLKDQSDAAWVETGFRDVVQHAAELRQGYAASIRSGKLVDAADAREYQVLLDQARSWGTYTGRAADHFVAAAALAYGVRVATDDKNLKPQDQAALANQLGSAAVAELAAAFQGGYIRRSSSFSDQVAGRSSLADLQEDAQWDPLRDRADFQQLLEEIERQTPEGDVPPANNEQPHDDRAPGAAEAIPAE